MIFKYLLEKFWVVCFYQMFYLTSPSYIDFVYYVHFKIKHNLYLSEYALNVKCMAHLAYHANFF